MRQKEQQNTSIDPEQLSGLVGSIYDASIAPEIWPAVLEECREFVGGYSAALYAKDLAGLAGGVFYSDGVIEPRYAELYFSLYARLDPATAGHLYAKLEQPINTTDILDYDEFKQSRFYKEWAQPQGLVDFLAAPIEKAGGWAAMFGVFRHERQGLADAGMRERMALIVPHVRRAVLFGKVIENASFQAASLGDAFDGLAAGMFLVDGSGQLMHANAAGQSMLESGAVLRARGGRLAAADRTAAEALIEALAAAGARDAAVDLRGVSVAMPGADGENYVAHILPLTSGERRRTGVRYGAAAALFVHRALFDIPAPPEVMARTFGLTLTELRVTLAIVQVGGVPETADALGIAETTVKTHLHRVFAKTGTSRQADLVRLVAGFASPLSR